METDFAILLRCPKALTPAPRGTRNSSCTSAETGCSVRSGTLQTSTIDSTRRRSSRATLSGSMLGAWLSAIGGGAEEKGIEREAPRPREQKEDGTRQINSGQFIGRRGGGSG